MSRNNLVPAKPTEITLDTLPQLFAHHKARFGGWSMTSTPPENEPPGNPPADPPARPEGVSEEEWNALGDPGRNALIREREARQAAERALAASRARPTPPKPNEPPKPPANTDPPKPSEPGQQPDIAAIVQQAVAAAIQPFQEAEERRQTDAAAGRVRDAVLKEAETRLHDATDALTGIDLASVVNEQGEADPAKVTAALEDLTKRKPHLAKSTQRIAPLGIGGGAPAAATDAEKVKAALADMQRATGVKLPSNTN